MHIKKLLDGVIGVMFANRVELNSTMLRFGEYYESAKFRGKIFTLHEFKKWYIKNSVGGKKTGKFTYYHDWSGFNIPSTILKPFYDGKFNPLSDKEKEFLKKFKKYKGKYYIIAVYRGMDSYSQMHEIAHALFYINPEYRNQVLRILKDVDPVIKKQIFAYLRKYVYNKSVWMDEMHAYILTGLKHSEKHGVNVVKLIHIRKSLEETFFKYYN